MMCSFILDFLSIVDEFKPADIVLCGKGGYTDDWYPYLRNLYPRREKAT